MDGIQSTQKPRVRKVTMYYVTGVSVPRNFAQQLDEDGVVYVSGVPTGHKLPRTELAKFFELEHAEAHRDALGAAHAYLKIEVREEPEEP